MDDNKTTISDITAADPTPAPTTWICPNCGKEVSTKQEYCNKCGAYNPELEKTEEQRKKFCRYCGNELHIEAAICPGCGCPADNNAQPSHPSVTVQTPLKKKVPVMTICIIGVIVIAVAALLHLKIIPNIKEERTRQQIIEGLEGNTYTYEEYHDYTYIADTYRYESYYFKDEENCVNTASYFSDYSFSYKIEFEDDGDPIVVIAGDSFKVDTNSSGEVNSLTDTSSGEVFKKE